jgi:hypothetical protein
MFDANAFTYLRDMLPAGTDLDGLRDEFDQQVDEILADNGGDEATLLRALHVRWTGYPVALGRGLKMKVFVAWLKRSYGLATRTVAAPGPLAAA